MTTYFTSDLHFHHANVIGYTSRPFRDVTEMNASLIENWNSTVLPDDEVWIIGDVFFCKEAAALEILSKLNGKKNLIMGNHDQLIRKSSALERHFSIYPDLHEVKIDGIFVTMCHFPLMSWNRSRYGSFMLHGHMHSRQPFSDKVRRYDVGVDANNMRPVSWEQIKCALSQIPVKPLEKRGIRNSIRRYLCLLKKRVFSW